MPELRQDLVSGDWVILAPGRAKRPEEFLAKKAKRKSVPKSGCPFESLSNGGMLPAIATYPDAKHWRVAVVPNKYPSLVHINGCAVDFHHGIYHAKTGAGESDLIITRDHRKNFAAITKEDARRLFEIFQQRHKAFMKDACIAYVSTFCNWGPTAGASVAHPHYQMLALPIIPPHAVHSLHAAEAYFKKNKRCARCDIVAFERKEKKRIIGENRHAIAFTPYASKEPFEISVVPKRHFSFFSKTPNVVIEAAASLLQESLVKLKKGANDPDFNFFIHGAPVDGGTYPHHHWHIEVMPKISISAGFELSAGLAVNILDPDDAAKILRK
jgi:UDPglucose--hexose-1-phosphate uridylyltransferase